jgi:hypothetical protein
MPQWTNTHTQLQDLMKKEIEAMRKLLENLHQEEVFIVQKDRTYWSRMMEERTGLIADLSELRQSREATTEKLESMEHSHGASLEDLLPPDNENSWDLVSLRDQILALLDRISLQSSRNEMLTHLEAYQPAPQKKTKISIATLPQDDYNDVA